MAIKEVIGGVVGAIGKRFGVGREVPDEAPQPISDGSKLLIRDNNYHFRIVVPRASGSYTVDSRGGVTVVYRKQADGSYRMACSVCSMDDNYSLRIGRQMASGYANSDAHKPLSFSTPLTASNASAVAHAIAFAAATSMVLQRVGAGYISVQEGAYFLDNLRLNVRTRKPSKSKLNA